MKSGLCWTLVICLIAAPAAPVLAQNASGTLNQPASDTKVQDQAPAQSKSEPSLRVGHRQSHDNWQPSKDVCRAEDLKEALIYPDVGAAYVGGTIAGLRMGGGVPFLDPYGGRQLRRKGRLALTRKCLLFAFKPDKDDELQETDRSRMNLSIIPCKEELNFAHKTSRSCTVATNWGEAKTLVLAVPYRPIAVLSRARYASSDLLSLSAAYAVAAAGLLAALSQGIKNAHTLETSIGAATGALALLYYFFVFRPRQAENYIGIFVENEYTPDKKEDTDETDIDLATPKLGKAPLGKVSITKMSDELYVESDVVIFKITNYHDYYNVSLILNGMTGLTFVSESAEKPTK